jgi:hypothetical protein
MKLRSANDETEKNCKRFEAFFSSFACVRFDDVLRPSDETQLKRLVYLFADDTQSAVVEHRFVALFAREYRSNARQRQVTVSSSVVGILRGLITTVAHARRNKPGKIAPFIGHKVSSRVTLDASSKSNHVDRSVLGCGEDLRIRLDGVHRQRRRSFLVSIRLVSSDDNSCRAVSAAMLIRRSWISHCNRSSNCSQFGLTIGPNGQP